MIGASVIPAARSSPGAKRERLMVNNSYRQPGHENRGASGKKVISRLVRA